MPICEVCKSLKSKLNQGRWCTSCFRERNVVSALSVESQMEIKEIAGISIGEIEQIPAVNADILNQPITTGTMLKIIADVLKPIRET